MNRPRKAATRSKTRRWSAKVTKHSDALDLERDAFKAKDPRKIALSLKRSAEQSKRRKGTPYQSAMSMLNFYINRAGKIYRRHESVLWNEPKMNCAMSLAERRRRREAAQALQNFREIRFMPARN